MDAPIGGTGTPDGHLPPPIPLPSAPLVRFAEADDSRLPPLAPLHWRRKAAALRSPAAARLELVAAGLLFDLLSPFFPGARPDDLAFDLGAHGKPFLPDAPRLHFNLSHTPGIAMAVVASVPVGCDVERSNRPVSPALVQRVFSPSERSRLLALPEQDRPHESIRVWTLKEAYLKALGTGFQTNPASIDVSLVPAHSVPAPPPYAAAIALLPPNASS